MKSSAYTAMMDRVLIEIDQGTMPWRRPWRNGALACVPARNTGEPFTGGNILLLSMAAAFNGFSGNRWFTFKQAEALGGRVRLGEKSSVAILCNRTTKDDGTGDPEKVRHLTYTKAYSVFCSDQIDGLDPAYYGRPPARRELSTFEISDFIRRLALPVQHKGDMAYYDTRSDQIVMPHPDQFDTLDDYQSTLLHEAGHLTGSTTRLNRKDLETYHLHASRAREELTAELIAVFLGFHIGLRVEERLIAGHASYLRSWHTCLKKDPEELVRAAARAQKACDWLIVRASATSLQAAA